MNNPLQLPALGQSSSHVPQINSRDDSYQTSYTRSSSDAFSSNASVETPKELRDKYRIIREVGHGAQGHVYEAISLADNSKVAIKELRIDSVQNWKEYDLFKREANVLQSVNIKGIAKFYEAMEFLNIPEPRAYIIQEYIDGRSFEQMMKSGYRFSIQRIFHIAIELIELLEQLHSHDPVIIHRDIKPSNILLRPSSGDEFDVFLIDFGAVANPQVQSGGSTVAGTFGYMPPEQLMGKPSPASDIYALAATLVFVLSGVSPADMQISDFRLIIDPHLESLPPVVVSTLRHMLEPKTNQRLCDYKLLKDRFLSFYENRFEQLDALNSSPENLNALIKSYAFYGDNGQINIWSNLSDATPREIPEIITQFSPRTFYFNSINHELTVHHYNAHRVKYLTFIFFIIFFVIALAISVAIIILYFISLKSIYMPWIQYVYPVFILFPAGIVTLIKLFLHKKMELSARTITDEDTDKKQNRLEAETYYKAYQNLLKNGRKTIATIVDISYRRCKPENMEFYFSDKKMDSGFKINKTENKYETDYDYFETLPAAISHASPVFTIRYKFNPPDDASENDLIHEITTHISPFEHLHVGAPLPILYHISPFRNNFVQSMPYPFPLNDVENYQEIIGTSAQN